jgi:hypothetical protein
MGTDMKVALGPQGAANPKLPLGNTIALAYSTYVRNIPDVLRASWLWLALILPLTGVASWLRWSQVTGIMAGANAAMPAHAVTDASRVTGTTVLDLAVSLIWLLAGVSIAVAWHRRIILGEHPGLSGSNVATKTLWRYVLTGIDICAIIILLWLAIVVSIYLSSIFSTGGIPRLTSSGYITLFLVILVFHIAAYAAVVRLSLLLPACAVGDLDLTFKQTWKRTRGNTWRLWWGIVACMVPPMLVSVIVFFILIGPPRPDLFDSQARDLSGGEGYAVRVAAMNAIFMVYNLLTVPIWIGFLSHAYRHFFRRMQQA